MVVHVSLDRRFGQLHRRAVFDPDLAVVREAVRL